jgi:hypothetical protein
MIYNSIKGTDLAVSIEVLDNWVTSEQSVFSAIRICLDLVTSPTRCLNDITFVMGREESPVEQASREKFCSPEFGINKNGDILFPGTLNCHFIDRLSIKTTVAHSVPLTGAAEIEGNKDTSETTATSMSGSKVRLLIYNKQYDELYQLYKGLINKQDIDLLIKQVREGLYIPASGGGRRKHKPNKTRSCRRVKYNRRNR